jgi:hypothetical protein
MAVQDWIDEVAKLAGEVSDGQGRFVTSYRVYERNEMPTAILEAPSAVTFVTGTHAEISQGGCREFTYGITEFHLEMSADRALLPDVMLFIPRIRNAFAAHMKLGGKVAYIALDADARPNIEGPVVFSRDTEAPRWGLIAHWVVKEDISDEVSISI